MLFFYNTKQHIQTFFFLKGNNMQHLFIYGVYIVDTTTDIYVMDDFGSMIVLNNNIPSNLFYRFS